MVRELMQHQEARLALFRKTLPLGDFCAGAVPWGGLAGALLVQKDQEATDRDRDQIGSVKKDTRPKYRLPSGFDPEFTLLAFPHRTFRARIFYLSTVASPDTHMFECKAEIDLPGLDVELRPGYTARIRLPLRSNPNACVVRRSRSGPASAASSPSCRSSVPAGTASPSGWPRRGRWSWATARPAGWRCARGWR